MFNILIIKVQFKTKVSASGSDAEPHTDHCLESNNFESQNSRRKW